MITQGRQNGWRERAAVLAVFSGNAALSLVWDVTPPVIVQLAEHFGGGEHGQMVAQFASSLPFFGIMIGGLIVDYPVRRWGVRNVVLVALAAFGLLGSVGAVIDEAWMLLLTRLFLGLASGVMLACCFAHVAVRFEGAARARMIGWMITFGTMTGIGFILVSGYIASAFDWRTPFLLHAIVSIIFLVPVCCMEISKGDDARKASGRYRSLKPTLPVLALAVAMQAISSTYQIHLAFLIGTMPFGTPSAVGIIFALLSTAVATASFAYARWLVHLVPSAGVVRGFILIAIGIALSSSAWSFATFVIPILIYGAGIGLTLSCLFSWAMRSAPPELATKTMGLMYTCLYFGAAAGPAATAPLPIMLGIPTLFVMIAAGIATALLLAALVRMQPRSRA
jgi:MFS family permease